jgi:hypothetical protein
MLGTNDSLNFKHTHTQRIEFSLSVRLIQFVYKKYFPNITEEKVLLKNKSLKDDDYKSLFLLRLLNKHI